MSSTLGSFPMKYDNHVHLSAPGAYTYRLTGIPSSGLQYSQIPENTGSRTPNYCNNQPGFSIDHIGVSKNRGTPKWMVYNGKLIKKDDLGVPLFLETSIYSHLPWQTPSLLQRSIYIGVVGHSSEPFSEPCQQEEEEGQQNIQRIRTIYSHQHDQPRNPRRWLSVAYTISTQDLSEWLIVNIEREILRGTRVLVGVEMQMVQRFQFLFIPVWQDFGSLPCWYHEFAQLCFWGM